MVGGRLSKITVSLSRGTNNAHAYCRAYTKAYPARKLKTKREHIAPSTAYPQALLVFHSNYLTL